MLKLFAAITMLACTALPAAQAAPVELSNAGGDVALAAVELVQRVRRGRKGKKRGKGAPAPTATKAPAVPTGKGGKDGLIKPNPKGKKGVKGKKGAKASTVTKAPVTKAPVTKAPVCHGNATKAGEEASCANMFVATDDNIKCAARVCCNGGSDDLTERTCVGHADHDYQDDASCDGTDYDFCASPPPECWQTSAVTTMADLFAGNGWFFPSMCNPNNIGSWQTEAVTDMSRMFIYAAVFNPRPQLVADRQGPKFRGNVWQSGSLQPEH